jgi:hypothetical protein
MLLLYHASHPGVIYSVMLVSPAIKRAREHTNPSNGQSLPIISNKNTLTGVCVSCGFVFLVCVWGGGDVTLIYCRRI